MPSSPVNKLFLALFQIITDFDMTLSKFAINGKRCPTCHSEYKTASWDVCYLYQQSIDDDDDDVFFSFCTDVIDNCKLVTDECRKKLLQLKNKYYPIEIDPHLTMEEKYPFIVEW